MEDQRRNALLHEYDEGRNDFRALAGIRFQLLAFLPNAAATPAALGKDFAGVPTFSLLVFGLVVKLALVTYTERNVQLYHDLLSTFLPSLSVTVHLAYGV